MLKLMNTLSQKKELFTSLVPGKVTMYVCGVTPYDTAHLGHGRSSVSFDILYRTLKFLEYSVVYCRNFTDVEDKLINRSIELFKTPMRYIEIGQRYIKEYHEAMIALNCCAPDYEPLVTAHIPQIIIFIEGLIAHNYAYVVNGSVYYSVNAFADYGQLSKQDVTQLRTGTRSITEHEKRDPLDFALWKHEDAGTFWQSPWGYGRPGWHIECSALAAHYLGEEIDIHGGGLDLIFPHHENEIAQSQALTKKPLAHYWLHNGMVRVNGEKMSKSLGNFVPLNDLIAQCDPMVLRFYFLNHHYRAPLDFSLANLEIVKKSYQKLARLLHSKTYHEQSIAVVRQSYHVQQMLSFVLDDLNTVGMIGYLFEHATTIAENDTERNAVRQFLIETMGLSLIPVAEIAQPISAEIQQLLDEREKARSSKNWKHADELRDILIAKGIQIQDKKL